MGKSYIFFSSWKFSGLLAQFSTFIIWVTIIMLLGMQNHLQPNKLEGVFQKLLEFFKLKPRCIYKYQIIKKNVLQGLYILGE